MRGFLIILGASALTTLAACATPPATTAATAVAQPALVPPLQQAENAITTDLLLAHIKVLASDEFEGRLPGTPGEDKRPEARRVGKTCGSTCQSRCSPYH